MFSQKIFSFNFSNFKVFTLSTFSNYRYVLEFYPSPKNDLMNINTLTLHGTRKKTMYHTINTEHGPCILPWKIDVSWYKIQTCIPTGVTLKCGIFFNVLFSHNSRLLYMYIMLTLHVHNAYGYWIYKTCFCVQFSYNDIPICLSSFSFGFIRFYKLINMTW